MRMVRYMIGRRDAGNADQVDAKKQMEREDRFYKELDRGSPWSAIKIFFFILLGCCRSLVRNY